MKIISLALMTVLSSAYAGTVYDHKLKDIDGNATSLAEHKGKVILIVNVASRCGFTRQYKGLEELHQKFKDKGLVICGFPCNQFGGQEPGSEKEIKEFCSSKFGVTFPMYSKIDVNGPSNPNPDRELLLIHLLNAFWSDVEHKCASPQIEAPYGSP